MPAQITLPIVGSDYPNKKGPTRLFVVGLQEPGDPITLKLEPENPADENAVAVYSIEGVQMGYIPAERAPYVGMMMRRSEVSAIFQGRGPRGAFVRIAFDEEPILPPVRETSEVEPEWWPDEEWPD